MDKMECSLVICGVTLAGIGACAAAVEKGRDALIIERTGVVGSEFIETINPGHSYDKSLQHKFSQQLKEDCKQRNMLKDEGPIHLPALHPILCDLIKKHDLNVRFLTEIVSVVEENGKYNMTIFDSSGWHQIIADEVLDTSSLRLTQPGSLYSPARKSINAYIHHSADHQADLPSPWDASLSVVKGAFPLEIAAKLQVHAAIAYSDARQYLHQYWLNRPEEWMGWTISAIAGEFEFEVAEQMGKLGHNWTWLPSAGFSNPLAALDQGYDFYTGKEELAHASVTKNG